MGMKQTLDVLNRMEVEGVIDRYAIGGAVGAYNYIEPAVTEEMPGRCSAGELELPTLASYISTHEPAQTDSVSGYFRHPRPQGRRRPRTRRQIIRRKNCHCRKAARAPCADQESAGTAP